MVRDPAAFNWVAARAKCNVRELFEGLKAVVRDDVREAEEHVSAAVTFEEGPQHTTFTVVRRQSADGPAVAARRFHLAGSTIEVLDKESRPVMAARASLVDIDCMLEVDGYRDRFRLWQFSRFALEDLFFNGR